jgi:hypothetical protein
MLRSRAKRVRAAFFAVARTLQNGATGEGHHNNTQSHPFSQGTSDFDATMIDVLYENALDGGGAFTVEGEFKQIEAETTAVGSGFYLQDGDSYYVTVAYLLPSAKTTKYQPYLRFVSTSPDTSGSEYEVTELGLNIVFRGHNGQLNVNYNSTDPATGTSTDSLQFGVQVQI